MAALRKLALGLTDLTAAGAAFVLGPLLRRMAYNRGELPRFQAVSDRFRFALRGTHYYEPTYRLADLPADTTTPRDLPGLDLRESEQLALLDQFSFGAEMQGFPERAYTFGDAASLYSMIRHFRPRKLIEIGCGRSTRVAIKAHAANAADAAPSSCEHTCIEPYEMPWLEETGLPIIRKRVEDVPLDVFEALEANDILFIDSSHVIRPHGDVLYEFQQIVPRLKPGVLVHVHDIFTPRDYPERWLRVDRRLWNEQYLLETMLAHNPRYAVVLATNWLKHDHWDAYARAFPIVKDRPAHNPGAFWFRVN
jgi:hypothetical protein